MLPLLPAQRRVVVGLLLAHAGLLALFLSGDRQQLVKSPPTLMIANAIPYTVARQAIALEPTVSTVATDIAVPQFEIGEDIANARPTPGAAAGCVLIEAVQAALVASPAVREALDRVPDAARSVSGAVLFWDRRWIRGDEIGGDTALQPIAAVVVATVHAAPADCRNAPITGPRLAFVKDSTDVRILAFGSGNWNWSQLPDDSAKIVTVRASENVDLE